jgi:hypothetical protein
LFTGSFVETIVLDPVTVLFETMLKYSKNLADCGFWIADCGLRILELIDNQSIPKSAMGRFELKDFRKVPLNSSVF